MPETEEEEPGATDELVAALAGGAALSFEPDVDEDDLLPGDRVARAEAAVAEAPPEATPGGDRRRARPRGGREGRRDGRRRPDAGPDAAGPADTRPTPHRRRPTRRAAATGERTGMADISAELVKELRERTGAGFMDCKRALDETDGDLDKADRAPARAGPGRGGQEGRPRRPRGPRRRATSTPAAASACSSRSTARPTSWPAPTSSSSSSATSPIQVAGLAPLYVDVERIPADDLAAKKAELLADEATQKKPENIREQIVEGQLKKWYQQVCLFEQPFRDEERTVARAHHRADRHDRREHPGPPLRPLRARGGAVSEAGTASTGRARAPLRYRRILLKLSGEALLGDRQYGVDPAVLRVHRPPGRGRSTGSASRSASSSAAATSSAAWPPSARGHGPRDRRLHRHARDGHERPRPPGRPRAGRRPDPGHDRDRDERDRRAVHPAAGDPPPREGPRHDLRGRAPATRTSRPTRPPRCAPSRSTPRSCSRRPRSTASTTRTR